MTQPIITFDSLGGTTTVVAQAVLVFVISLVLGFHPSNWLGVPLDNVPKALKIIASINPVSYTVDALRGLLINQTHFGLPKDFAVLAAIVILLAAFGVLSFKNVEL